MKQVYRHYKGGLYEFIAFGKSEATGADMAVYKSLQDGEVYMRPVEEWDRKFALVHDEIERLDKGWHEANGAVLEKALIIDKLVAVIQRCRYLLQFNLNGRASLGTPGSSRQALEAVEATLKELNIDGQVG